MWTLAGRQPLLKVCWKFLKSATSTFSLTNCAKWTRESVSYRKDKVKFFPSSLRACERVYSMCVHACA